MKLLALETAIEGYWAALINDGIFTDLFKLTSNVYIHLADFVDDRFIDEGADLKPIVRRSRNLSEN
jgi:hypothetical protein